MSETEELRAELTRLGVEWTNRDAFNDYKTVWHHGHTSYLFIENIFDSDITILKVRKPTIAQVIAATLGTETCYDGGYDPNDFVCSECGAHMFIETDDTYTMMTGDENIIKRPNYCPNCGALVVGVRV